MGENLKDLERRVSEDDARIMRFVRFGAKVARKLGKCLAYEERDDHIPETYEITDFYGFSIYSDTEHSMFGGNDLTIKYEGGKVLELYYENETTIPKIKWYAKGPWEALFGKMSKNGQKYINGYKAEKRREVLRRVSERGLMSYCKRKDLLKEIKKFGVDIFNELNHLPLTGSELCDDIEVDLPRVPVEVAEVRFSNRNYPQLIYVRGLQLALHAGINEPWIIWCKSRNKETGEREEIFGTKLEDILSYKTLSPL